MRQSNVLGNTLAFLFIAFLLAFLYWKGSLF